ADAVFLRPKNRVARSVREGGGDPLAARGQGIELGSVVTAGDTRAVDVAGQVIAGGVVGRQTEGQGVGGVAAQHPTAGRVIVPEAGIGRAKVGLDHERAVGVARIVHAVVSAKVVDIALLSEGQYPKSERAVVLQAHAGESAFGGRQR